MKFALTTATVGIFLQFSNVGCDTPEGANALARALPRIKINGLGFNGSLGVPTEALKSSKLKFQEAVVRGDATAATRHIKAIYVNQTIKGLPPVCYAAMNGNTAMILLLARHGANLHQRIRDKSLAYVAAAYGHNKAAEELITLGGGSTGDLRRGHALYAENQAAARRQAAEFSAAASRFLQSLSQSGSGNGIGRGASGASLYNSIMDWSYTNAEHSVVPPQLWTR